MRELYELIFLGMGCSSSITLRDYRVSDGQGSYFWKPMALDVDSDGVEYWFAICKLDDKSRYVRAYLDRSGLVVHGITRLVSDWTGEVVGDDESSWSIPKIGHTVCETRSSSAKKI